MKAIAVAGVLVAIAVGAFALMRFGMQVDAREGDQAILSETQTFDTGPLESTLDQGPAQLEADEQPAVSHGARSVGPLEASPIEPVSFADKYRLLTDEDLRSVSEGLNKRIIKLCSEYLGSRMAAGEFEIVAVEEGKALALSNSSKDIARFESETDANGQLVHKVLHCAPDDVPAAAPLIAEWEWLAQEIDARGRRSR